MPNSIILKGVKVHNLKNISVEIPKNKMTVITGPSGSGKSSLAFDTIYAEGQRRYAESLSSYARQFLGVMDKPAIDQVEGLSPTIAIDQRTSSHNPRSTVGTTTEIYDYLRLLFTYIGRPHCPKCGLEITKQTPDQITKQIIEKFNGKEILVIAPVKNIQKKLSATLKRAEKNGYKEARINGIIIDLAKINNPDEQLKKDELEIIIDRSVVDNNFKRINDLIKIALELGDGTVIVFSLKDSRDTIFSQIFVCPKCGYELKNLELKNFSFNSPYGACPTCSGLGKISRIDPALVIPNPRLTLAEGAIKPWIKISGGAAGQLKIIEKIAPQYKFSVNTPVKDFSKEQLNFVLWGDPDKKEFEGVIPALEKKYKETTSEYIRKEIENYMRSQVCSSCNGARLKKEILSIKINKKSISEIAGLSILEMENFIKQLNQKNSYLSLRENQIAEPIIKEITARVTNISNVGLNYLSLDRAMSTLSGGEVQRLRLASQIGSSLSGIIYILDEPSIGLHPKDNSRLIETLKKLKDLDNTIIVVEHDEATILAADHVIDIGPGAGEYGGEVVAIGSPKDIKKNKKSLTGLYLSKNLSIEPPKNFRKGNEKFLKIIGASANNLKNIDVKIPLGALISVTGVSGSGKSTLIEEILSKELAHRFYRAKDLPGKHKEIKGIEFLDKVITINQAPIGRTPRSNPATYTGVFTYIRDLFTENQEAKIKGYDAGKFSFNVKGGGRCETCGGEGSVKIEMQFLPDVYIECEECHGKRYNAEALQIHYRGKNIADVLDMAVEEASLFFEDIPPIFEKLQILESVGLGYLRLGQPATTLSGGEAQRIKLAAELSRRATGKTLYILDEPTTGLHFDDIKKLLSVLNQLVDKGNTVLIIEHNLDVIKCADWVIDLGPEGGKNGGYLVAEGTPIEIMKNKKSYTGQYLRQAE
ncbi:excinuclease ABC subunit A [Candidatus Falkowbacteria bacterium RIFOXYB2_FULL_38_15]|uniref:UvrABC system protein A n=1 Tax=Candidatus Falkowbacteria bacterium RIFOXYA2_FULL_38_12 TaxID=1797993 RepID=A0A1F5S4T2_9BACT|nr:MAG: excinuclease ABC subunit A [Candidatus Falkowbacteria bacterium RIFOXYA2_FULL_38_12]OGF32786.1 MAG: excinuclease ABC subunit A [Candidatus Falkowbacteria bacterium RIFOXYB2_FULL_38_15]OGF42178.1 MAG: excinuclease ABC subunit A [Candidatus Falkowbacteria bacterium RIFOXYD2_FULL_39_16]